MAPLVLAVARVLPSGENATPAIRAASGFWGGLAGNADGSNNIPVNASTLRGNTRDIVSSVVTGPGTERGCVNAAIFLPRSSFVTASGSSVFKAGHAGR